MIEIGDIGNYYGGLTVRQDGGKCYWSIEDWDGHRWEEIPPYLYESLIKFEQERAK